MIFYIDAAKRSAYSNFIERGEIVEPHSSWEAPMTRIETLARLADLMGLSARDTVALPTVITVAAGKVRMAEAAFIAECAVNAPLRAYLAQVCATVSPAA